MSLQELQEMLNQTEPNTIGYALIQVEIAERVALEKSLEKLI